MDGKPANLIKCPICFELPEKEIYQCKQGHTICHKCCDNLELCPQCRVPFDEEKIRNRALEDLIANMGVMCHYRKGGCREKIPRKELKAHAQICQFRPVRCCKIMGLNDGECEFSNFNADQFLSHISQDHGLSNYGVKPRLFRFTHLSFKNVVEHVQNEQETITFPKLVTVSSGFRNSRKTQYLICHRVDFEQGDFSIFCIHVGKEALPIHNLTIKIKSNRKDLSWIWRGIPTHFKIAENWRVNPPFKIPIRYILELDEQGGLYYKLHFTNI